MWFVAALIGAGAWGAADFLGGIAARRERALTVLVLSTPCALLVIVPAVVWSGWTEAGLGMALLAGAAGGAGLACLYSALAIGPMNVVAPASAVVGASVPVAAGLAAGERPGPAALLGIIIALCAVALVSREPDDAADVDARTSIPGGRRTALLLAGCAGLGIGLSLVLLEHAAVVEVAGAREVNLAPLLPARMAAWAAVVVAAAAGGGRLIAGRTARLPAAGAGVLDGTAYVCYLVALSDGLLSVVGVLVSLYPAGTVLMARVLLGERMSGVQLAGLAMAGAGVALMVLG